MYVSDELESLLLLLSFLILVLVLVRSLEGKSAVRRALLFFRPLFFSSNLPGLCVVNCKT